MRLSQLSAAAGLSPATEKWYLRIGLLPRGEATAVNQAQYDEGHLRRLRLIRALVEVGGLSTDAVRDVVTAIDDPAVSVADILAIAHRIGAARSGESPPATAEMVDAFVRHRGWHVNTDSPARNDLAAVISAIADLAPRAAATPPGFTEQVPAPEVTTAEDVFALLDPYADAIEPLAAAEVTNTPVDLPRDLLAERIVAGTILLERAIAALRRLAQEHYATPQFRD